MSEKEKRAKLAELMAQMDPQDRAVFKRSREKFKPNLDHDLFVASLHVPPRGAAFSR